MIKTAQIIEDESGEDEVGINNTVTVFFPEDNETDDYRIVTTVRGNSLKGLISIESPLGKALMKHKVGDKVTVQVSEQVQYDVIIKNIDKTSDDSNDKIRGY